MFGITGAHRTGKTTLAEKLAEKTGVPFIRTSASATFARLGYDPKTDYDFDTRLDIQAHILTDMAKTFKAAPPLFIADRTPIDAWVYMLADIQRGHAQRTDRQRTELLEYFQCCRTISKAYFKFYLCVQPGIQLVEAEGKAPADEAYIEHLNLLTIGLLSQCGVDHHVWDRTVTNLDRRIASAEALLQKARWNAALDDLDNYDTHAGSDRIASGRV